jgi:hypothetical protein
VIQLEGLTHKQKMLAQLIWDCETQDQLEMLIKCLPTREDRYMASTLSHVMIHEALEPGIDRYAEVAQEVIDSVR